ncbi:MAG: SDR family oxidoreductase [Thermoleophilaceae bacterium]|jgi:NAD(P)-dependent dehydrogenase (short-subunit alcohol dehydrogenase family)|nr:SDR family oxidoreductase [Thermoleophilaceae bacterium]
MAISRRRSNQPRRPLTGRVVAVTGGARGLGLAMAQAVAARGARVAIGDLDADLAAAEAAKLPGGAAGLALDVTDPDSFKRFLDATEERLGPLDVLVNNAGIMVVSPFLEEEESLTRRQIDINLHGVITGMRLAIPGMQGRRTGHVVNVASAAGKIGVAGEAVYVATKHAVVGLSEAVRLELQGTGVELSVMMPGLANTELASGMSAGRGVKLVEPAEVGTALVDALERPRFEIYVPPLISGLLRLHAPLPQRARDAMSRFFQTDQVAMKVDKTARAAYAARASAGMPPAEPVPTPASDLEARVPQAEAKTR